MLTYIEFKEKVRNEFKNYLNSDYKNYTIIVIFEITFLCFFSQQHIQQLLKSKRIRLNSCICPICI